MGGEPYANVLILLNTESSFAVTSGVDVGPVAVNGWDWGCSGCEYFPALSSIHGCCAMPNIV